MGGFRRRFWASRTARPLSFQLSMNVRIAPMRSLTEVKVPRRIACRVMMPKKISPRRPQVALRVHHCRSALLGFPRTYPDMTLARGQRDARPYGSPPDARSIAAMSAEKGCEARSVGEGSALRASAREARRSVVRQRRRWDAWTPARAGESDGDAPGAAPAQQWVDRAGSVPGLGPAARPLCPSVRGAASPPRGL